MLRKLLLQSNSKEGLKKQKKKNAFDRNAKAPQIRE